MTDTDYIKQLRQKVKQAKEREKLEQERQKLEKELFDRTPKGKAVKFIKKLLK